MSALRTSPPRSAETRSSSRRAATADGQNSRPTTAAASAARRSAELSRSIRAASTIWIVNGSAAPPASGVAAARIAICSTKSGFPSAIRRISRRIAGSRAAPPTRPSSADASASDNAPSRRTVSIVPTSPHPGRASRSSGRASANSRTGCATGLVAKSSMRSRNAGSAHCMSSSTTNVGPLAATARSSSRAAAAISTTVVSSPPEPTTVASDRAATRSPPRSAAMPGSSSPPVAATTISRRGQKLMPSPYGRACPTSTDAVRRAGGRHLRSQPRLSHPWVADHDGRGDTGCIARLGEQT